MSISAGRLPVILLVCANLALSIGFGWGIPVYEAPDENHHYAVVRYIATEWTLPVVTEDHPMRQEAAQPPLYYLLGALITAPLDHEVGFFPVGINPFSTLGDLQASANHNVFIHHPLEKQAIQGGVLALHILRLLSAVLGLVSVLCIWRAGVALWPGSPERGLAAAALVSVLPQWHALHSAVTNDGLIIMLCCLVLLLLVRQWREGATRRLLVLIGVLCGLAILTKLTGVLLLVFAGGVMFLQTLTTSGWRQVPIRLLWMGVPALAVSGWLFGRNWLLYGDITAVNQFVLLGGGERQLPFSAAFANLHYVWLSLVGVFGWMNLTAPAWVFGIWAAIASLALAGGLFGLGAMWKQGRTAQHKDPVLHLLLLCAWPLLIFGSWFQFNLRTPAEQGRLLFPAILPVALLFGYGLTAWPRPFIRRSIATLTIGGGAATALYCVAILIPAAYAQPVIVSADDVPATIIAMDMDMGQGVYLLGYDIHTPRVVAGEPVVMDIYWRRDEALTEPASYAPNIAGQRYVSIGARPRAYHGAGTLPTTLWPVGAIVKERVVIPIDVRAATPTIGRLYVQLDGQEAVAEAEIVKVVPRRWPDGAATPVARFVNDVRLGHAAVAPEIARPGDSVTVSLRWHSVRAVERRLVTFVHMGPPDAAPLVQADGPALNGDYPAWVWGAGEVFDDVYTLHLPESILPGDYPVRVGLYDLDSGERILLNSIDGEVGGQDGVMVGIVSIR